LFHCWKDIWCWKLPCRVATSENDRLHIYSLWFARGRVDYFIFPFIHEHFLLRFCGAREREIHRVCKLKLNSSINFTIFFSFYLFWLFGKIRFIWLQTRTCDKFLTPFLFVAVLNELCKEVFPTALKSNLFFYFLFSSPERIFEQKSAPTLSGSSQEINVRGSNVLVFYCGPELARPSCFATTFISSLPFICSTFCLPFSWFTTMRRRHLQLCWYTTGILGTPLYSALVFHWFQHRSVAYTCT
jgi:hypothetical protein